MKRRAWKVVLGLVGGMVLVVGVVVGDAHRRASATFAQHEKEVALIHAQLRARDPSRPSIYPDPLDGNGWPSYVQAFTELVAMPQEDQEAVPEIDGTWEEGIVPDDHLLHDLFARYQPQVALLEKGARSRIIEPDYDYERGAEMPLGWLTGAIRAARFLNGAVAHHSRMGNGEEALRLTVLALAVSQDLPRKGPVICSLIQYVCENLACEGLRGIFLGGHSFTREQLEAFLVRLDALDAQRPSLLDAWTGEEAFVRSSLLRPDWSKMHIGLFTKQELGPTWRHFFSKRILQANALNVSAHLMGRASRLDSLPLQARVAELNKLIDDAKSDPNPLVRAFQPPLLSVFERDQVAVLGRTLLRVSVAVARYQVDHGRDPGRLEDLVPRYLSALPECPLTRTPFRYRDGRLWSVGVNRTDEGGIESEYGSNGDGGADGDVVWTVRRK